MQADYHNSRDTTSGVLIKKFSDHQPYFILHNNKMLQTNHQCLSD